VPSTVIAKSWIKKLTVGLYLGVLVIIGGILFFPDQLAFLQNFVTPKQVEHASADTTLMIGYAAFPQSFDPVRFDPVTRSYLTDIYQGLVGTDRNLKVESALAVSWGMLDPLTWEFRLRPNVQFHNGKKLTVDDVKFSLDRARSDADSQLRDLLNTVVSVETSGPDRVLVKTSVPDPLLLSKLAVTAIVPDKTSDFTRPIGTGPYQVLSQDSSSLTLQTFKDYWDGKPYYGSVKLVSIPDREDRIAALEKGTLDILANVPPNVACSLVERGTSSQACEKLTTQDYTVQAVPSLEVTFLMMNQKSDVFSNIDVRKALRILFDHQALTEILYGFAHPSGQFVSNGVFGFNPGIIDPDFNLTAPKAQLDQVFASQFSTPQVTLDYPESLQSLAEIIKSQMGDGGIQVALNPLSDVELFTKIENGESDLYLIGWKSELGDAFDFLKSVAHSKDTVSGYGQFNGTNLLDLTVDQKIESSEQNLDPVKRLRDMQSVMKTLVEDDVMGIPLYESETLFASKKSVQFVPAVDGYIKPSDIR
jgi:peptide/nickel transport system substrate-binding protein